MTSTAPTLPELRLSVHAAEHYCKRVKSGLDLAAARAELERLRLVGEITLVAPGWLYAAKPAPHDWLIGDALALPVLPREGGWIATPGVTNTTLTPTRCAAKPARRQSPASRRCAGRRALVSP